MFVKFTKLFLGRKKGIYLLWLIAIGTFFIIFSTKLGQLKSSSRNFRALSYVLQLGKLNTPESTTALKDRTNPPTLETATKKLEYTTIGKINDVVQNYESATQYDEKSKRRMISVPKRAGEYSSKTSTNSKPKLFQILQN